MEQAYFVADIGGTNARFSLVPPECPDNALTRIYSVADFPTVEKALAHFCTETNSEATRITRAAMAFAAPVLGDRVKLTNADWIFDKASIEDALKCTDVAFFNDSEAIAMTIPDLRQEDLVLWQQGVREPSRPLIVLGVGTGLGLSGLVSCRGGALRSFAAEAGHTLYPPANTTEKEIIETLSGDLPQVTAENLISGPGLVHLYQALSRLAGQKPTLGTPAEVVALARQGDALCNKVLHHFASMFGHFAGQMALSWLPLNGIYLTGGIVDRLGEDFDKTAFLKAMSTNPRMGELLAMMPVYRINAELPALRGLVHYLIKASS